MRCLLFFFALPALAQFPASPALRKAVSACSVSEINGDERVVRWSTPPSVSVWSEDSTVARLVEDAVTQLNTALKPARFGISLMAPNSSAAQIRLVFCRRDVFPQTLKQHGAIPFGERNWGWYRWWDENRKLSKIVIVMSYEQGETLNAKQNILQALFVSLGPPHWLPLPNDPKSAEWKAFDEGKLTSLETQFLPFFYAHLHANDREFEVRRAFDKFWR
jgi:hypothetical protein